MPAPTAPGLVLAPSASVGEGVSFGANVVVHAGTQIGSGVRVGDNAVLGKQPVYGRRSTARREPLAPLVVGEGGTISTGAVVYAGVDLAADVIVGDLATVRERCRVGVGTVIGRGVCVENDTTIGARCRIQSTSYITAYMTIEDDVFIAPCVVTTNDNFMGRTEERFAQLRGPTIRRGARIGGAVTLLPGIEVGEEAFVGAGAVVLADVPSHTVVVGVPARALRRVPDRELLGADDG